MHNRSQLEHKYDTHQPVHLKFLDREPATLTDEILKADLLLNAIKDRDVVFAKEIISSPGNTHYLDFRLRNNHIQDYRAEKLHLWPYSHTILPAGLPRSALTLASYYGLSEIVDLLIQAGANVNLQSGSFSPLDYAVYCRKNLGEHAAPLEEYQKIVASLIKNGAIYKTVKEQDEDKLLPSPNNERSPLQAFSLVTRKVLVQPPVDEKKHLESSLPNSFIS